MRAAGRAVEALPAIVQRHATRQVKQIRRQRVGTQVYVSSEVVRDSFFQSAATLSTRSSFPLSRGFRSHAHSNYSVKEGEVASPPPPSHSSSSSSSSLCCPLCLSSSTSFFAFQPRLCHGRITRLCHECHLLFVPAEFHLSEQEAKARYDTHQNHLRDEGYRMSLMHLVEPLAAIIKQDRSRSEPKGTQMQLRGLDYGSGVSSFLAELLEENIEHCSVLSYDPLFRPAPGDLATVLSSSLSPPPPVLLYDFIAANEVVEHFSDPRSEFLKFSTLLRPGGLLAVGTRMVPEKIKKETWEMREQQEEKREELFGKSPPTPLHSKSTAPQQLLKSNVRSSLRSPSSSSSASSSSRSPSSPSSSPFSQWWYARDPTHICYYADETFHWIAHRLNNKETMTAKAVSAQNECSDAATQHGEELAMKNNGEGAWKQVFRNDRIWIGRK